MKYKRIMLKLSGEGLAGKENKLPIDPNVVKGIADQIKKIVKSGTEVAIVIGGGNFWRGAAAAKNGIERNTADYIGMLATIMNALALRSSFENLGLPAKVLSAISMEERIVESYSYQKANRYLERQNVVIFAGGTGRPFFTTDTTAALVASEIGANLLLMAKNGVDGVYTSDPETDKKATKINEITYTKLISLNLQVMDQTAASMAKTNKIKTIVFNVNEENAIVNALQNKVEHTTIEEK